MARDSIARGQKKLIKKGEITWQGWERLVTGIWERESKRLTNQSKVEETKGRWESQKWSGEQGKNGQEANQSANSGLKSGKGKHGPVNQLRVEIWPREQATKTTE